MTFWVEAFNACHYPVSGGLVRTDWPDGKEYMEQENILIEMFQIIYGQAVKVITESIRNARK